MNIRVLRPQPRVHEFEHAEQFASALDQAAAVRRNDPQRRGDPRQEFEVWIQVEAGGGWLDWEKYWSGYDHSAAPVPPRRELYEAAKAAGAQRARCVTRSTI